MIHSENIAELAAALCAAQAEFSAVPKTSENPFFKSKYAGLPDVVAVASPILTKHGIAVSQLLGHGESGDTLTTVVLHKSGQFMSDTMQLRPVKNDPQAQGSATTYGRRYAYMAALGLVADEDDDGNAGSASQPARGRGRGNGQAPAPKPAAATGGASADTLKQVGDAARAAGVKAGPMREMLAEVGVHLVQGMTLKDGMAGLTEDQATALMMRLAKAGR